MRFITQGSHFRNDTFRFIIGRVTDFQKISTMHSVVQCLTAVEDITPESYVALNHKT